MDGLYDLVWFGAASKVPHSHGWKPDVGQQLEAQQGQLAFPGAT